LQKIVKTFREEGRAAFPDANILIGDTFDIGPEFAVSDFKYRRHNEICKGRKLDCGSFVDATLPLKADDRPYAAYPTGIPEGTLFGTFLGKHKLCEKISPKKTVEGAIGGIASAVIAYMLFGLILDLAIPNMKVNYIVLAVFALVLSVVSQLGDLIASLIKREHSIKDFGNLLPGHGGIMDRFDSIMAVSTILLILSIVFPPFTLI
jgi:hypothetical protein